MRVIITSICHSTHFAMDGEGRIRVRILVRIRVRFIVFHMTSLLMTSHKGVALGRGI